MKVWRGDSAGNLVYRRTAHNFNPVMATAAHVTIADVEHLVRAGEINPDYVVTPGIFVQYILQGKSTKSGSKSARSVNRDTIQRETHIRHEGHEGDVR